MAVATHILPQDVLAMKSVEFLSACKRILGRAMLPSSSHKGKERPLEEFEHALRKRALRTSGALNPKGGLYPGMPLPKTPDYQTRRNDLVNCVNNPAYAAIRKAVTEGDIDTVEQEQKVRGRGLLRRGIAPAPYKYPKIGAPISYYYADDDPTACSLSDAEDVELTLEEESGAAAAAEEPATDSSSLLKLLRTRRAAAQKAKEDQEVAEAAAREAAAASDAASIAAERVLAAAEAATSASLLANIKARDAARFAEQAKLSQQSLATLVSNDC